MLPDDAFAAVMVISMAAHTAVAALADGFDAFFEDVHAQVDAGMVGVGEIGLAEGARVSDLAGI